MTGSKRYGMRSLRFRLALASVVVEAVMLTVLVWNSTRITGDAMREIFRNRVETLVPLMNVSLVNPLAQRDYATLDEQLGRIVNRESLTYIEVRDELGNLAAKRGEVPTTMQLDTFFETADGVFDQAFDITVVNRVIGRARYGLNVRLLATTLASLRAQGMVLALIEIGLTFLLLATLGYLLTRHLQTLAQAARALEGGDYAVRVADAGRDEVADTAHAFNSMAATIERDITDRKRAEAALIESKEQYRRIVELSPDAVTIHQEGRWVFTNSAAARILGVEDSGQLVGRSLLDFMHPDIHQQVRARWKQLYEDKQPVDTAELQMVRPDGSVVYLETCAVPVVWQGRPAAQVVARDITERKLGEQLLRESEGKYRGLVEQASDGIFVIDVAGRFLLANVRCCELLGYTESELLDVNHNMTYLEEERAIPADRIRQAQTGAVLRYERMVRRKDGSVFSAEFSGRMLDKGLFQVIFHDITNRRSQERKIARLNRIQAVLSGIDSAIVRVRDREEMFREACRIAVNEGAFKMAWIGVIDPDTLDGSVVAWSGGAQSYVGKVRLTARAGTPDSDRPACVALREMRPVIINDIASEPSLSPIRTELLEQGHLSTAAFPLIVDKRAVAVLVLHGGETDFFDEQEIKLLNELAGDIAFNLEYIEKEERLHYLAYHDALTGLPNRTLLQDRLGQNLHAAQRNRRMVALILMDIDRFHLVNDTLGRSAGDSLLKEVAVRLQAQVRAEDTVARVGADSFAVALADVSDSAEVAHFLRDRVSTSLRHPVAAGGQKLRISARFGVALYPSDGATPDTLYANAEAALKKTQATGEPFLFYAPEMNSRIAESLTLENKLRNALEQEQFVLYYQPKVTVRERTITGLEALIRWKDPELGLVPPLKFIPLMEETGLILEAGRWALSQVARDNAIWVANGIRPPRVAVNVSPIQLRQKNFIDIVVEAAKKAEEAGGMLDLEITESVIMENVETIIPMLQTVRGLGVEIAVDDFGTGYSSLAYIARLPIHALKIDRSFIVGMTESEDSLAIVNSVISLAHSLRLKVVAEGVETEEQAALLLKLGCDEMQGYLFSRPVPPERIPELLRQQNQTAHVRQAGNGSATAKKNKGGVN